MTAANTQRLDVFFLDVEPGTPRYGYTAIVETGLHDGMSETILAHRVVVKPSDGVHLLASLKSLRVINDEEDVSVVFAKRAPQHVQGNILHHLQFAPAASPQKLPVIGSLSGTSQGLGKASIVQPSLMVIARTRGQKWSQALCVK